MLNYLMSTIKRLPAPLILILLATGVIYFQTISFGFVSWDDPNYVVQNTDIHDGITWQNIQAAFTSTRGGMWLPMVWISYMFDIESFGINPGAMHLMNLFYHLISTVLVFVLLMRLTGEQWASLAVASLFALHPLRVESVVWITERKDVLSMLFFLLSLLAYHYYAQRPSILRYSLVAMLFMLAIMAKPMVVTLPFVLLLLDYWPLKRIFNTSNTALGNGKVLLEKLPLLLMSVLGSLLTLYYQSDTGATHSFSSLPLLDRIGNALISYIIYLEKVFVPVNLAFFYPLRSGVDTFYLLVSVAILLIFTAFAFAYRRTKPYLLVGWLWYLGTLFPVSGISQAGLQAMADRFTYIPLIGIFIMLAWGCEEFITTRAQFQRSFTIGLAALVFIFAAVSYRQIGYWQNDRMLFAHAVEVTQDNYLAQVNLAGVLEKDGDLDKAAALARASLQLKDDQAKPYIILGKIAISRKQAAQAVKYLSKAVILQPDEAYIHFLLGNAFMSQRNPRLALNHYLTATRLDDRDWEAFHRIGIAYASLGDIQKAIVSFSRALSLNPDNFDLKMSLALATEQSGNMAQANNLYSELLRQTPDNLLLYKRLAHTYYLQGNNSKALEMSQEVLRRDPNDQEARAIVGRLQH